MKFFVSFLSILALIVVDKVNATFLSADCSLDSNECKCGFDFAQNYSIMICQSILEPDQNRLPSLPCHILRVVNGFDRWPVIPFDGKSKEGLLLSENQIDTIGDLTNLDNLEYLNISHNRITKINSSMSSLQKLALLDLSFNLLEQFHFEDLVPYTFKNSFDYSQPISGTLEYLFLNRNQIKQIINFDLALVGMPLCNVIALDDNMLTSLDVFVLSQQSQNVIEKIKQALTTNDSYLDIFGNKLENSESDWLNSFGNLGLLSVGENSSYNNQDVRKKKVDFDNKQTYDSLKLAKIYSSPDINSWGIENIKQHQQEMITTLQKHYKTSVTEK
jgi:Leucine-rich repeat (LRR) protein